MRIYLKLCPNNKPVPFNYQENLSAAFNKWVGENMAQDDVSLYSFSWLEGGRAKKDDNKELKLNFPNGAKWFISCWEEKLYNTILEGIRNDPAIAFGFEVRDIVKHENPDFSKQEIFQTASPIFIKRYEGKKANYYYYDNPASDALLLETLKHKMKKAGIEDDIFSISFERAYKTASIKTSIFNGITYKASLCPVILKGKPLTKAFVWNVGLGNSTGIGFGALK